MSKSNYYELKLCPIKEQDIAIQQCWVIETYRPYKQTLFLANACLIFLYITFLYALTMQYTQI